VSSDSRLKSPSDFFSDVSSQSEESNAGMKRVTWQSENCLSCTWFRPNDPVNADLLERGMCVEPKLKAFELVVTGRDWCNLFKEIRQRQIDILQEKAMKGGGSGK